MTHKGLVKKKVWNCFIFGVVDFKVHLRVCEKRGSIWLVFPLSMYAVKCEWGNGYMYLNSYTSFCIGIKGAIPSKDNFMSFLKKWSEMARDESLFLFFFKLTLFLKFIFNWRKIGLQCCIGFCCIAV